MLTIEEAKQIKWYRQSGAGVPICIGMPFLAFRAIYDRSGFYFPNAIVIVFKNKSGSSFYNYFDYNLTLDEARKITETFDQKPELFKSMKDDFYQAGQAMEKTGLSLLNQSVQSPEFKTAYEEFLKLTLQFWGNSLYIDLLDPAENMLIDHIFGQNKEKIGKKNINVLMSPDELSALQKEQKNLLEIYQKAKSGITEEIKQLLKEHSNKYYWLKNDYEIVEFLDEKYYLDKLEKLIAHPEGVNEITPGLKQFEQAQAEKKKIIFEQNLDEKTIKKLNFFNWITTLRDDRKKYTQICNYILIEIAKKISQELNLDLELIKQIIPNEIPQLLLLDSKIIDELKSRQDSGVIVFTSLDEGLTIKSGQMVKDYFDIIEQTIQASEIKGATASAGKAIGQVKIILNQGDFAKMEQGDILVASMTRPEYAPIMKKAAAIVTDEGGITCHAAIVSRELGIPCITGTQIATKTLKDGDLIDVNANHGLVKIIKKGQIGLFAKS